MVYFRAQTHVLGCRSLFQCVFCVTAGVSTSSTRIEEGQPGGVRPMVIQEPDPGPPQWWGDWERGDGDQKPPPLSDTNSIRMKVWKLSMKERRKKSELHQSHVSQ